jgi:hypothetical protein
MKDLVMQTGDFGISGLLYLPNGDCFEYNRLVSRKSIDSFAENADMRQFYGDDMMYAFATAIKEAGYAPPDKKTPQDDPAA